MQLKQDLSKPKVKRQILAIMVAQQFNKGSYIARRIINWEREWISTGKTSETKAGKNKHTLSWMDDKDLILAVKTWDKEEGDSRYSCSIS